VSTWYSERYSERYSEAGIRNPRTAMRDGLERSVDDAFRRRQRIRGASRNDLDEISIRSNREFG